MKMYLRWRNGTQNTWDIPRRHTFDDTAAKKIALLLKECGVCPLSLSCSRLHKKRVAKQQEFYFFALCCLIFFFNPFTIYHQIASTD